MKYLRLTLRDNDFTYYLSLLADYLYHHFVAVDPDGWSPDEEELQAMIPSMLAFLEATYHMWHVREQFCKDTFYYDPEVEPFEKIKGYFEKSLKLEVVNEGDIPTWDNAESVFVPLSYSPWRKTFSV